MTYRFVLALAAALLCGGGAAKADGLVINFHVQKQEKDGASAQTLALKDYAVTLFPQSVDVRVGDIEEIYDFAGRRYYMADHAKKTLVSYELYAIPISYRMEKDRRQNVMFDQLKKSQPSAMPNDVKNVDTDMMFASQADAQTSGEIKTSFSSGATSFTDGDRRLATVEQSDVAIPDALKASYGHFFLYETALHPVIDSALGSSGTVAKTLEFVNRDGGNTSDITLTMTSSQKTTANGPEMRDLSRVYTGTAAVDAAIKTSAEKPMPTQEALEAKITGYLAQKDALRAVLAAKEMALTLGGTSADASAAARQAMQPDDPLAKATIATIGAPPHSTEEFLQHMGQLNKAKEQAPEFAYLIEFLRAQQIEGVLASRQNPTADETKAMEAAFTKMQAAIAANPWLTAAYCDLGDVYFSSRDPRTAATLWEQASRLNPRYPGLERANLLQQHALKDFPEYF